MGHFLDLDRWKRREHYQLFRSMSHPFFSVCVEVDATTLREKCGEPDGPSFFLAALYLAYRAANATEAFRLRLRDNGVWLHDHVRTSTTVLREDGTFAFAVFPASESFAEFQARGRSEMQRAKTSTTLSLPEGEDDLIYHSSLPWFRFTSFTNAIDVGSDSVPRIVFGKCEQDGARWRMPVAVEVHHALVDGLDVAHFIERFQTGLNAPDL